MKHYILYLNLPDSYCQIFLPTENNRKYELELSASLDALEAQLGSRFVRTHRSYLVNQRHILSYDAGTMTVTLDDESVVYLSPRGKSKTEGGFGMATSYRFTEDEFVFLAYFYQCMTVPAWFLCEPEQIDPEKALRTLPARLLCRGFLELVEQSMGIPFGSYRQALLMSERTGRILSPEQTLDDADIDSGDTLYLV